MGFYRLAGHVQYIRAIPLSCRPDSHRHDVVIRELIAFEIWRGGWP